MDTLQEIFGEGTKLSVSQMTLRAIVVFMMALIMLKLAGKRTFGNKSALDNVIMILLGAILSRVVAGASPFLPAVTCCFAIVLLHRLLGWLCVHNQAIGKIVKGEKTCLYKAGVFQEANMEKVMISKKDIFEGIRLQINEDALDNVAEVYAERDGEIGVVKKK